MQQLMYALDMYCRQTRAIEGLYTKSLSTNEHVIDAPPLALRSKTYRFVMVYIQGVKYLLDVVNINPAETAFRYQWQGVPRWLVAWQDKLYVYPTEMTQYYTTTLTQSINKTDVTIQLENGTGLLQFSGFIQIGEEKIAYKYRTGNTLYECERGIQSTTAESHDNGTEVKENNFWVYYFRLHYRIPVINNVISNEYLNRRMEVCDEHMEIITSYTADALLAKIDPSRGQTYEKKFQEQIQMAKAEIFRGRKMTNSGGNIRGEFFFESQNPGVYLV